MIIALAILLTLGVFGVIVFPFFRPAPRPEGEGQDERLSELNSNRDTTYAMLKELEFDLQAGVLTPEDYRDLESRYKARAVAILHDIDALEGDAADDEIERLVLELRRSRGRFCPRCGARRSEADLFCALCGASLNSEAASD